MRWKPVILGLFVYLSLTTSVQAISLSGPITSNMLTVTGGVVLSSMTVSSMTVTNSLQINGISRIKGLVLQTFFSSTTVNSTTTSTTLTDIPGMAATLALSDPNNYVRLSLSGMLATSNAGSPAKVSIMRDSSDLGQGGFACAYSYPGIASVGITITDSPGDTSAHTYKAVFKISASTSTATFTASPAGYFLVEEIAR